MDRVRESDTTVLPLIVDGFSPLEAHSNKYGLAVSQWRNDHIVDLEQLRLILLRFSSVLRLWSKWTGRDEPDLLSFAAVTDDPPVEIALAGHDRCIIPIKPENINAWLNPDPADLAAQYAILDDRHRPYYQYRLAA